jgi:hypothetical protein
MARVEYVVPIAGWTSDQPPTLMGAVVQARQWPRIFYLHA